MIPKKKIQKPKPLRVLRVLSDEEVTRIWNDAVNFAYEAVSTAQRGNPIEFFKAVDNLQSLVTRLRRHETGKAIAAAS